MRKIFMLLLWLLMTPLLWAGVYPVRMPEQPLTKVERLAHAIAKAEGFYVKGSIPNRYHNVGDIKAVKGFKYEGQIGIGKGRHVIFATDADGWRALNRQLTLIAQGYSKHYSVDMTLQQLAKKYAGNWRVFAKNLSHSLGVPQSTTLKELLYEPLESQSRTPGIPRST